MEQLIHAFGIDIKLITIQIINFVLLLSVLSYFLYKPILKLLADREEKIRQGLQDAETAAKAKALAESEKQAVLSAAHLEAEEIAKRGKAFADEKSAEAIKAAETKANQLLTQAQVRAEELKVQVQKDGEAEIAKVAILAAEKILRQQTS